MMCCSCLRLGHRIVCRCSDHAIFILKIAGNETFIIYVVKEYKRVQQIIPSSSIFALLLGQRQLHSESPKPSCHSMSGANPSLLDSSGWLARAHTSHPGLVELRYERANTWSTKIATWCNMKNHSCFNFRWYDMNWDSIFLLRIVVVHIG